MSSDKKTGSGMTPQPAIVKSVDISASTNAVWQALTEPEKIKQWMSGAQVESSWEPGTDISFSGTMPNFNIQYRDHGTILAMDHEKVLQYSLWSQASRRPDLPQNRTLVTFTLERMGELTRLTIRHEGFHSEAEYKHANFFWTVAPSMIKKIAEEPRSE